MSQLQLPASAPLGPTAGIMTLVVLGLVMSVVALFARAKLVKNTHDFVIAGRNLGFGFGVAGLLSIWTWVVGILMPIAVTYQFGLSGLWWFTVPNGVAVVAVVPFATKLKRLMPRGYTISEFIAVRYRGNNVARAVVVAGILFGALQAVIVNLKGASLVVTTVFGLNEATVAIIASIAVLLYTVVGGLWASVSTSTLMALLILVPSAIVASATVGRVGGFEAVWQAVSVQGRGLFTVTRHDAFSNFGLTFMLALITATVAGQEFWQVAWALKRNELGRTFFWGGGLYYPVALCLGVVGLVGLAVNVDLTRDLHGDAAALGPFLLSHLGLPRWVIYLFVTIVLAAAYSTIDSGISAVGSIAAVDIIKPLFTEIEEKRLLLWTRLSMVLTIAVAVLVVLSGVDFVTLLLGTSVIRGSVLVPLVLSIVWKRMNAAAFIMGTLSGLAVGIPVMIRYGQGTATLWMVAVSGAVPLAIGLFNGRAFDYGLLRDAVDL
jgi:Na+/proline symporter